MPVTLNASTSAGLIQTADTSGTIQLQSNGSTILTVASTGVTANNLTSTGTFGGGVISSGTAVSPSGTASIDFTGIPSWVKRITVMFSGISTNGTSNPLIQLGDSGGVETSGYSGLMWNNSSGVAAITGAGIPVLSANASATLFGEAVINLIGSNLWEITINLMSVGSSTMLFSAGSKTLSATLDRVRITTVNGTDAYDAGTINILYEG
jgi:hypothetical protein